MSASVVIRPVEPTDYPQWKTLWDGYNAFYDRKDQTALPDEVTRLTWDRFFDGYEPMHALVAEQSDQLLGLFHRTTIALTSNCYLQDLFTVESARGRGVGRALIQEVYRHAGLAHCARIYWHTHETNETAMKLYDKVAEKSGFVVSSYLLDATRHNRLWFHQFRKRDRLNLNGLLRQSIEQFAA